MGRRRNPRWKLAAALGSAVLGFGAIAYASWAFARPSLEPLPWPRATTQDTMPSRSDFPMGWSVEESGSYENYAAPGSSAPHYQIEWKILRLPTPSTICSPPCAWVTVWAGSNSFGIQTTGWTPVYSLEEAIDLLEQKHDEVS